MGIREQCSFYQSCDSVVHIFWDRIMMSATLILSLFHVLKIVIIVLFRHLFNFILETWVELANCWVNQTFIWTCLHRIMPLEQAWINIFANSPNFEAWCLNLLCYKLSWQLASDLVINTSLGCLNSVNFFCFLIVRFYDFVITWYAK